jgi:hypothetical protein
MLDGKLLCKECYEEELQPDDAEVERAYPPYNPPYNLHDVLNFYLQRLRSGHAIVIGPCSSGTDEKLESFPSWMQADWGEKSILPRLPGPLQKKFRFMHWTPFFCGPHDSITVGEIEANRKILSALGYDFGAAVRGFESVCSQWPEEMTKNAAHAIKERIKTIDHIHEYPVEFQDAIWDSSVFAKNYSLATDLGYLGAVLAPVAVFMWGLSIVNENPWLLGFGYLLLFVSVLLGFYGGVLIGGALQSVAAKRGVVYRRSRRWLIPIRIG